MVAFAALLKIYLHHFLLEKLTAGDKKTKRRGWSGLPLPGACLGWQRAKTRRLEQGLAMAWGWGWCSAGPPQLWNPQTDPLTLCYREAKPKPLLQKPFLSRNSGFVPRFNRTKKRKSFSLPLTRKHKELHNVGCARWRDAGRETPLLGKGGLPYRHGANGGLESQKLMKSTILAAEPG